MAVSPSSCSRPAARSVWVSRMGIPEPIAAIVLKLLSKTAEDRYQTAAGVEAKIKALRIKKGRFTSS
jgi:hypothetical protein